MARDVDTARRLAALQRSITEQRRLELERRHREFNHSATLADSIVKTLEDGGLAWQLFADMSTRFMSGAIAAKNLAAEQLRTAAESATRDSKRLDILDERLALARRKHDAQLDDEERLEAAQRPPGPSLPQA
jgi:hypothetical protein